MTDSASRRYSLKTTGLLVFRVALGLLFIWSGIAKMKNPMAFADDIRNFRIVSDPWPALLALYLPWVETICGIVVLVGKRLARGAAAILTMSLLVFIGAVAAAWVRGLDISCGCFGTSEAINYPVKLLQNTALLAVAVVIFFNLPNRSRERRD